MTKTNGYTELQAQRLLDRLDKQTTRICDEMEKLSEIVPDTHSRFEYLQRQVMNHTLELQDVVRRRRR